MLYIFYLQGTLVQLSIEAIFNPGMTHCRRVALGPCNLLLWRVFLDWKILFLIVFPNSIEEKKLENKMFVGCPDTTKKGSQG